jgi:hypothetical protein
LVSSYQIEGIAPLLKRFYFAFSYQVFTIPVFYQRYPIVWRSHYFQNERISGTFVKKKQ